MWEKGRRREDRKGETHIETATHRQWDWNSHRETVTITRYKIQPFSYLFLGSNWVAWKPYDLSFHSSNTEQREWREGEENDWKNQRNEPPLFSVYLSLTTWSNLLLFLLSFFPFFNSRFILFSSNTIERFKPLKCQLKEWEEEKTLDVRQKYFVRKKSL